LKKLLPNDWFSFVKERQPNPFYYFDDEFLLLKNHTYQSLFKYNSSVNICEHFGKILNRYECSFDGQYQGLIAISFLIFCIFVLIIYWTVGKLFGWMCRSFMSQLTCKRII
jgi:hypothetical protein